MDENGLKEEINLPGALIGITATMEDVSPDDLVPITGIPDFLEPCHLPFPVALHTSEDKKYHILDNWVSAAAAIDIDARIIRCLVYHVRSADDITLMAAKLAVRIRPMAGVVRYPEILRNIALLGTKMSGKDIVAFSRGGDRKSSSFQSQNNMPTVLSAWTGKAPKTISGYLTHAACLNPATLNILANEPTCTREFFELVQRRKQGLRLSLSAERDATEDQITEAISTKMLEWWEQHHADGHLGITGTGEQDAAPEVLSGEPKGLDDVPSLEKKYSHSVTPKRCQDNAYATSVRTPASRRHGEARSEPLPLPAKANDRLAEALKTCLINLELTRGDAERVTLIDGLISDLICIRAELDPPHTEE